MAGWLVFFSFVHWHLTPFIICTLHHWNPVSYLLNSGTNGWLVHVTLLTAWRCPYEEERGMKGNRLCCEILSYRQKGAAKCSNLYLTSDLRSSYKPLNLGLKLRNKVYKHKEEISSTRYLCPGLILEIKKKKKKVWPRQGLSQEAPFLCWVNSRQFKSTVITAQLEIPRV